MKPSNQIHVVVLAAGKGTRMKSEVPKVLHGIAGLSIIERVLRVAATVEPRTITVVVGHGADALKAALKPVKALPLQFVVQERQLGTGHALLQTRPVLEGKSGTVVLLSGDAPLLTGDTLRALARYATPRLPRPRRSSPPSCHGHLATAELFVAADALPRLSRSATPPTRNARSPKSTPASTPLLSSRSSTRSTASAPPTTRASTTFRISSLSIASNASPSPPIPCLVQTRSAASIVEPNSQRSAAWSASRKTKN